MTRGAVALRTGAPAAILAVRALGGVPAAWHVVHFCSANPGCAWAATSPAAFDWCGAWQPRQLTASSVAPSPLSIARIDADHGRVAVVLPQAAAGPVAVVDFSTKPLVNLVWIGALIMLAGTSLAGLRRAGEQRPGAVTPRPAAAA